MERLLLRPTEAAELLGVGRTTMYALLATGEIPSVRVGKSIRVPAGALERWVSVRTAEPAETVEPDAPATGRPR